MLLKPGMSLNIEVHPIASSSSYNTVISSTDCAVVPPNTAGSFSSNIKGFTGSALCDHFSTSDGFLPIEHHWRLQSSSFAPAGNDMPSPRNLLGLNVRPSLPKISTRGNVGIISNGRTTLLPGKKQPKQDIGCQNGRFLHNINGQEISRLSHMPSCNGFPNGTHNGGQAFKGNFIQMTDRMTSPEGYLNSHLYGDTYMTTDCSLSAAGNLHFPATGFTRNYKDTSPMSFQSNFTFNPAWRSSNLNFQTLEQAPQLDQHLHRQNLQYQKHSVENLISHVTEFEGTLQGLTQVKNGNFISDQMPMDLQIQGFSKQINGQDMSCLAQPSLGRSISDLDSSFGSATVTRNWTACGSENTIRKLQDNEKQELLLLYYHARGCLDQGGECQNNCCKTMKQMLNHVSDCKEACNKCIQIRNLLDHHGHCHDSTCLVCIPVRKILCMNLPINFGVENFKISTCSTFDDGDASITTSKSSSPTSDMTKNFQPSSKRLKTEHPSFSYLCQNETSQASLPVECYAHLSYEEHASQHVDNSITRFMKESKPCEYSSQGSSATVCEVKTEDSEITNEVKPIASGSSENSKPCENSSQKRSAIVCENKIEDSDLTNEMKPGVGPINPQEIVTQGEQEKLQVRTEDTAEPKEKCKIAVLSVDHEAGTMLGKPKTKGVSLVESFTSEQVHEHMRSLKQRVALSKGRAAKKQAMESLTDKSSCQLCGMGALSFEPPPIYCAKCYGRIKYNRAYHATTSSDTMADGGAGRSYFCNICYKGSHGDGIMYAGGVMSKSKLEKKRNDLQISELWVQCDKCEAWQHQICALFNGKRNDGGRAEYTCPNCYLREIEHGESEPLPQGVILEAKDLPKSKLSDHIEQRLFMSLKQERQHRANALRKNYDEVPSAEALIVRVVSSVDKKLEVKQLLCQIFEEENYPAEFPYKSKAILLFQKIDGADVCLFGMYVQEYGSECAHPNQRRVCLSYLDSVKYFRPEIKAVTGEALRTFVYHEILIGYLDYCKKRGFTSCYIWSCPPLKQEDFILNCHPEIQKTPKPDKLREWYLAMLRKATKEHIVVHHTKFYDYFFTSTVECKANVTAARLPYFDGDYWPGCAEDMLKSFQQQDGKEPQKKGRMAIPKRALKAVRHGASSDSPSKDTVLMFKLGDVIRPMREDLIMIHLQHACNHCCEMIVSGKRWVCNLCKNFQLCENCHNTEQKRDEDKHPINSREKHSFYQVEVNDVPAETNDNDDTLQSEFFDSRLAFLSLCQGNHYQYDTLRRAKHSTMMILYHLHNPTAPAFVSSCFDCHNDIETGQGWHCDTCPEYDVCDSCYQREGGIHHIHGLVRHTSMRDPDVLQNKGTQQRQAPRIQDLLDLLVHASKCRATPCMYTFCRNVKGLFHHGVNCKTRQKGGCITCKKMWYILRLHARACREGLECRVPRCRDLKDHMRKMESQSNLRRRAGVMERMRRLGASAAVLRDGSR